MKANPVVEYVRLHPGATNNDIAAGLGRTPSSVSGATTSLTVAGRLRREPVGTTRTGAAVYGYWVGTETERAAPPPPKKTSIEQSLAAFVDALAEQVVQAAIASLRPKIEEKLMAALPAVMPDLTPLPVAPSAKPEQKRIAVVGLLPQQAGLIQSEYGQHLDLRFVSADETSRCKSVTAHADETFIMSGFISHGTQKMIESVGVKPHIVSGGMSSLRCELDNLTKERSMA